MRIWKFYKKLLQENAIWLRRVTIWAGITMGIGAMTFILEPGLLPKFLLFLEEVFEEILPEEGFGQNFSTVFLIFKNNFTAVLLCLFLGIIFGIIPVLAIGLNFFILGFLLAIPFVFADFSQILLVLLSILPHSIFEIPALLIAAALGLRLGISWREWKNCLKQNFQILPLLVILLFLAAVIEIFVTGSLVKFLE